jgi:hypothetical protein
MVHGPVRGYPSCQIQRTTNSAGTVAEDVSVDHGRGDLAVAQELLDGADVLTALQKVGRDGVTEGVATGTLVDAGRADGSGHGALHVRLVVIVPPSMVSLPHRVGPAKIHCQRQSRDAAGKLPLDRFRQPDAPEAGSEILLMQRGGANELLIQLGADPR